MSFCGSLSHDMGRRQRSHKTGDLVCHFIMQLAVMKGQVVLLWWQVAQSMKGC